MRKNLQIAALLLLGFGTCRADVIYNNLTPNNLIGMASRPSSAGGIEIEAADDFLLGSAATITSASFVGVFVPGTGIASLSQVTVEIYRVFPEDSNTSRTIAVPTRANSPSDVEFADRDSAAGGLSFSTTTLAASFTAVNSIQPGGIHTGTGGNGSITGQEVQLNVSFTTPFLLPADHYFFVPQVLLTNGGQFYWLSASRPISGTGTTPFAPDLQAWTRDANLDPDWLRVGTDIVAGTSPPTFNGAFSLNGTAVPEPSSLVLLAAGFSLVALRGRRLLR